MTDTSLRFLSKAWIEKNGMFQINITPRGGMEFVHTGFRRRNQLDPETVFGDKDDYRKYRSRFQNLLPAHLGHDFEQCTVFYLDGAGKVLGSINFKNWIFDHGTERMVLAINEGKAIRLCLPPMSQHVVPRGTEQISFRFEWIGIDMKICKYSISAQVSKDLRTMFGSDLRRTHPSVKKVSAR